MQCTGRLLKRMFKLGSQFRRCYRTSKKSSDKRTYNHLTKSSYPFCMLNAVLVKTIRVNESFWLISCKVKQTLESSAVIIFNIFQTWWQKIKQDPTGWGALLLFAGGLVVLLTLMSIMPYVGQDVAL